MKKLSLAIGSNIVLALALVIVVASLSFGIYSGAAVAQDAGPCATGSVGYDSDYCKNLRETNDKTVDPATTTINNVATLVAFIGGFLAVMWIIIQGIRMATSYGSADKTASARNGIIYASVGLLVIVIAKFVIMFVLSLIKE